MSQNRIRSLSRYMPRLPPGWEERIAKGTDECYFYDTCTKTVHDNLPAWNRKYDMDYFEWYYGCTMRCSHILVKHNKSETRYSYRQKTVTRSKKQALDKITEAREMIISGKQKFGDVAVAISDCCSAAKGGDLGPFYLTQTEPSFENIVLNMKVGEISKIFETGSGYHIVMRTEPKKPKTNGQACSTTNLQDAKTKLSHLYKSYLREDKDPQLKKKQSTARTQKGKEEKEIYGESVKPKKVYKDISKQVYRDQKRNIKKLLFEKPKKSYTDIKKIPIVSKRSDVEVQPTNEIDWGSIEEKEIEKRISRQKKMEQMYLEIKRIVKIERVNDVDNDVVKQYNLEPKTNDMRYVIIRPLNGQRTDI